eukprot:7474279-Pyramimonas_sp.AAC.1
MPGEVETTINTRGGPDVPQIVSREKSRHLGGVDSCDVGAAWGRAAMATSSSDDSGLGSVVVTRTAVAPGWWLCAAQVERRTNSCVDA